MAERERPRSDEPAAPPASEGPRQTTNSNRQPKRTREERLLHLYATRPLAVAERAMKSFYGRRQQRSFGPGPGGPRR
jgi:hypothetical protein